MKIKWKYLFNEDGQSMVEYGLIIGILAIAGILFLTTVGMSIKNLYPILEPYLTPMS